jgi:hypothetical protein
MVEGLCCHTQGGRAACRYCTGQHFPHSPLLISPLIVSCLNIRKLSRTKSAATHCSTALYHSPPLPFVLYILHQWNRKGWSGKDTQPRSYVAGLKIEIRWRESTPPSVSPARADSRRRGGGRVSGGGGW